MLKDLKGKDAILAIADTLEVLAEIAKDKETLALIKKDKIAFCTAVLRKHTDSLMKIVAIVESKTEAEVEDQNIFEILKSFTKLINDSDLIQLFTSQGQTGDATSSGSASANITNVPLTA